MIHFIPKLFSIFKMYECNDTLVAVNPQEVGADLGGSGTSSNDIFEYRSEEGFHVGPVLRDEKSPPSLSKGSRVQIPEFAMWQRK